MQLSVLTRKMTVNENLVNLQCVMTVYENYDVIAFKSCIQIFTVWAEYHK
jgi:hypothetical protein